jgi:ribonuclease BN (tRNA processing enzyme)
VLLDLGQGSFPRLAGAIEPSRLDAVVISHLHPDHFIDLVPLRHYLAYQHRPARSIRVVAPDGLDRRIDALHEQPGFSAVSLEIETLAVGPIPIGDLTLEARRVTHTANSYAVRLAPSDGPGLVYSGDCGVADDLAPLIRDGDTLLVEVSFGAGPVPAGALHLNAEAIAGLAARTGPRLVLLTHLQMALDRERPVEIVRAATGRPVRLVEPGDVIDLPLT